MLNNLKKHSFLPAVRRWDNMFDSVMGKLDLFPGEELRSELDAYIHPDIEVSENYVNIRMALPGYTKDEIEVEIENDLLTVRAEHANDKPCRCKGKKILRSERIHTEFFQSVRLPGNVKSAEAAARCCDGVLTVSIPREVSPKGISRKIEVK
ncbi:MAG: Hsp20/alpha crystallin family protein [Lentisphaeria bacterium]|nr:Hsp20/alpha crystallin family protein [Lentisphaeria bacterium]